MTSVVMRQLASKSELLEVLGTSSKQHLLGQSADAPREFFCLELQRGSFRTLVGVLSHGIGLQPKWFLGERGVFVGFNHRVAVLLFDAEGVTPKHQIDLMSLFVDFVVVPLVPMLCVVAESAVLGLSLETGAEQWRVDTDLITGYEVSNGTLLLRLADSPGVSIDLAAGTKGEKT